MTRLPIPTVTPSATFSPSKGKTPVPVIPGGKDVTVEPEKDSAVLPEIKPEVKPEETVQMCIRDRICLLRRKKR